MYKVIDLAGNEQGPVDDAGLIQWVKERRINRESVVININTGDREQAVFMPLLEEAFSYTEKREDQKIVPNQVIGFVGAAMLLIGAFTPVVAFPVIGSVNLFNNGKGDGLVIIGIAIVSGVLALVKRFSGLWITSALALGILFFTFMNLLTQIAGMQESLNTSMKDNPFKGIADAMVQSVQFQWGWSVLLIGSLLLAFAAAYKAKTFSQSKTAPILAAVLLASLVVSSYAYSSQKRNQQYQQMKTEAEKKAKEERLAAEEAAAEEQRQAEEEERKQQAVNDLELVTWDWKTEDFARYLVGKIKNNSDYTLNFVGIEFNLEDEQGDKVGTASDHISSLSPGETWEFKALVFQDQSLTANVNKITGTPE